MEPQRVYDLITNHPDKWDKLSEVEQQVINLRYGVIAGVAATLQETAETLDRVGYKPPAPIKKYSRERVRQMEQVALRKMGAWDR